MKTVQEYRRHAEECRALAKQMKTEEQRDQLLKMAETWDVLAKQRERSLQIHGVVPPPSIPQSQEPENPN